MSGLAAGWAFGAMAPTTEGCLMLWAWAARSWFGFWASTVKHFLPLWAWNTRVWAWIINHGELLWAWNNQVWVWTCANPQPALLIAGLCAGVLMLGPGVLFLVWAFVRSLYRLLKRWLGIGVTMLDTCCCVVRGNMGVVTLSIMMVGAWIFPDGAWLLYLGGSNFLASAMGGSWDANSRPVTEDALFAVLWGFLPTATVEFGSMLWTWACTNPLDAVLIVGVLRLVWFFFRGLCRGQIGLRYGVDMWVVYYWMLQLYLLGISVVFLKSVMDGSGDASSRPAVEDVIFGIILGVAKFLRALMRRPLLVMSGLCVGAVARPAGTVEGCSMLCGWITEGFVGLWAWVVHGCCAVWTWVVQGCSPLWAWGVRLGAQMWGWACANPDAIVSAAGLFVVVRCLLGELHRSYLWFVCRVS